MKRVLITESIDREGIERLKEQAAVTIKEGLTAGELKEVIGEYQALIIRSKTRVTSEIIEAGKNLNVIGRAGVGVDNIDLKMATRNGVVVVNAPQGNIIAAAEHTLALMLSLARNIPLAHYSLKNGAWKKKTFMGVELYKKTLGIIGLGQIGKLVAQRVQGFGMKTIAADPYLSTEQAQKMGVELLPLSQVLKEADFLTLHTPKNKKTYHLIGTAEIGMMKRGCRLINCARGGIVDEDALYEALKEGRLAGAALDVFEEEPQGCKRFSPLNNVILTPHLGASTREAQRNVSLDIAREVLSILQGGISSCTVNLSPPSTRDYENVKYYLPLAYQMGQIYRQTENGAQNKIKILYQGKIACCTTTLITNTLLQGLLTGTTDEYINPINAPLIARERGIKVVESKNTSSSHYKNLIHVKIYAGKDLFEISGTLFGTDKPCIIQFGQYSIDLAPTENMLLIKHQDRPGIIGQVGSLLGEHNINIASMRVGREKVGGKAIMVLELDTPLENTLRKELEAIEFIGEVRSIHL